MFEFDEHLTVADVRELMHPNTPPIFHRTGDPFKALRRKQPVVVFEKFAQAWMAALPLHARPQQCALQYPRIVNTLAAMDSDSERSEAYLKSLLADTRGQRQGFPPLVLKELIAFRGYRSSFRAKESCNPWLHVRLERF